MKSKEYPESILQDVRQRLDLDTDDTSRDAEIMAMSPNAVFDHVCSWNGLVHYVSIIRYWIKSIYGIELK